MSNSLTFRESLQEEFTEFLGKQQTRFDDADCLRMDLHCHDLNSDKPSELWGRILGLPETWLPTQDLVNCLKKRGCTALTITNHNNATSCWSLIEQGHDILPAAEFTCRFPEYDLFIHVLTYGFTREDEDVLNRKRNDVYEFVRYAAKRDIPIIVAHPLYNYQHKGEIDLAVYEKMAVLFRNFEVLNAQRDLWQCVLTLNWIETLTPAKVRHFADKHGLDPAEFGVDPAKPKVVTGGSDDHMGIFAGTSGSRLYVPDLANRLKTEKVSALALEALRAGNIAPYGHAAENEKLNVALLDYFAQTATRMKDPGLLRMMLHQGEPFDKFACFVIGNILMELRNHNYTQAFFGFIHDALQGKKPGLFQTWKVSKDYRFCIDHLETIAGSIDLPPAEFVPIVNNATRDLFRRLSELIVKRIEASPISQASVNFSLEELTHRFEVPSQVSALLTGHSTGQSNLTNVSLVKLLDNLSFPVLVTAVLAGVSFASTRALYENREFLNRFADHVGRNRHQRRVLYLTDTLLDKNGVSNSLSAKLVEIQGGDMPIDYLICHEDAQPAPHLHVVRPIKTFSVERFGEQPIRIPDLMEVVSIFYEGGYDRIVCSTEGPMAMIALFLKHMFNVQAQFFMHTDWVDFARNTLDLDYHDTNRVRRLFRLLYQQFDGIYVLNSEHRDWLTGFEMQLEPEKVFLTAHHTQAREVAGKVSKRSLFPDATEETPVLLMACRISREKGVFELPGILAQVRKTHPDVRVVIAGSGPDEAELKALMPDACFTGWIDKPTLTTLYNSLDLFVFPSKFDTFGNVILEAFVQGMPVVAYDCKGPADIIGHNTSGYLVDTADEIADSIAAYFSAPAAERGAMRQQARRRAQDYDADTIMRQFLVDMGFPEYATTLRSAA